MSRRAPRRASLACPRTCMRPARTNAAAAPLQAPRVRFSIQPTACTGEKTACVVRGRTACVVCGRKVKEQGERASTKGRHGGCGGEQDWARVTAAFVHRVRVQCWGERGVGKRGHGGKERARIAAAAFVFRFCGWFWGLALGVSFGFWRKSKGGGPMAAALALSTARSKASSTRISCPGSRNRLMKYAVRFCVWFTLHAALQPLRSRSHLLPPRHLQTHQRASRMRERAFSSDRRGTGAWQALSLARWQGTGKEQARHTQGTRKK